MRLKPGGGGELEVVVRSGGGGMVGVSFWGTLGLASGAFCSLGSKLRSL
jgi:hypothetical protein